MPRIEFIENPEVARLLSIAHTALGEAMNIIMKDGVAAEGPERHETFVEAISWASRLDVAANIIAGEV